MKTKRGVILTVLFVLLGGASLPAETIVLTFDDLTPSGFNTDKLPAGYGGVLWPNNVSFYGWEQWTFAPQSLPNRVAFYDSQMPSPGETVLTFVDGPKIFEGAYFCGYDSVHFNFYSDATLVGTSSNLNLNSVYGVPTFLASGYVGPIDKVGVVGDPARFVMDNFTYRQIPEPATTTLFAVCAVSLLVRRRSHAL